MSRSLSKWIAPGAVAAGVIALVAIALLRGPAQFDPTTPEGAVQEYLQALSDADYDRAFEMLHEASFEGCDPQDLARSTPTDFFSASLAGDRGGEFGVPDEFGAFGDRVVDPDAWVDVTIRRGGGGGPFGSGWEEWTSFGLTLDDGFWWIVGDPWPHFAWSCAQSLRDF